MFRKLLITHVLIAGAAVSVLAPLAHAGNFDAKVRNDFFAGFAGDKAAMERALRASEETIVADSKEPAEAMA